MTGQPSPYVVVLALVAVTSLLIALYTWRRRSALGGTYFVLLMVAVAVWAFSGGAEFAALTIPTKIMWSKLSYVGVVSVSPLWLLFSLSYSQRADWLTRRRVAALWIVPLLVLGLAATNEWHRLIWPTITPVSEAPGAMLIYGHGPGVWAHAVYAYILLLVGTVLLMRTALRSPQLYRWQVGALLVGATIPWLGNVLYLFNLTPWPGLDLTPVAFMLTGLALAWGLFRFQMLDLAPVARDALIENMNDGVFALDDRNRIVDINPAACRMFGCSSTSAVGQPVAAILAKWPDLVERYRYTPEAQAEITVNGIQWLDLRISPLYDRRKKLTGRLIVLRDITRRKRAEESLLHRALEIAALYDTSLELNAPMALSPLLRSIVERAARLLGVRMGGLYLLAPDGESLELVAGHNLPADYCATTRRLGEGLAGRIAQTGEPMMIEDYRLWEGRAPLDTGTPFRRVLGVPLKVRDKVIGIIHVADDQQTGLVTEEAVRLVRLFADQAAVAVEKARLYEEARQNERYLTLLNDITRAAISAPSLADLLQMLADRLGELFDADGAYITLWDETRQAAVPAAASGPRRETSTPLCIEPGEVTMTDSVLHAEHVLAAEDVFNSPYISPRIAALFPARSLLGLPLIADGHKLGAALINYNEPHRFTPDEITRGEQVARQIALAVIKARLHAEALQRASHLSVLYGITQMSSRSLALDDVLAQALSSALKLLGFAAGFICLADTSSDAPDRAEEPSPALHLTVGRGLPPPQLERLQRNGFEGTLYAYVHERRQALTIDDLQQELPAEILPMVAPVAEWGWRAYIGIPLLYQAQPLGVISLFSRQPRTSADYDLALLTTIGCQVSIAVANAQLFQSTLKERSRLNALIKASRDGVILVGLDLCILVVNLSAFQLLRLPDQPEAWVGRSLLDVLQVLRHWSRLATRAILAEMRRIQNGDQASGEGEFDTPSRTLHWLNLRVQVRATPLGRLIVLRDITERKQMEEALRRKTVQQQQLLETTRDLTASLDLTEVLTRVATAARAILAAQSCEVYLLEADGQTLTPAVTLDLPYEQKILSTPLHVDNSFTGLAVKAQHGLIINDAVSAPGGFQIPGTPLDEDERLIVVPMMIRDTVLGAMCISRMGPFFSEEDLALAGAFAAHAATALKNAQVHHELAREIEERQRAQETLARRAEQLATLNRIGLALASGLDMDRVLRTLHEQCIQVAPVDTFYVALYDQETGLIHFPMAYDQGEYLAFDSQDIRAQLGLTGYVIQSRQTLYLPDTLDPGAAPSVPASPIRTGGQPTRSYLGVPLILRDQVVGILSMQSYQPNAYEPDHIRLLETIAAQAAIAIQNAQLYQHAVTEAERRATLYQATQAISASVDREQIAAAIHQAAAQVMPVEAVVIALLANEGTKIEDIYLYDAGQRWPSAQYPIGPGLTSHIITTGQSLRADNLNDEKIEQKTGAIDFGVVRDKPLAAVAVPLRLGGKVMGMLSVQSYSPSHYTSEDQELIETLAAYGAIAFENARLYAEARRRAQELEQQALELQAQRDFAQQVMNTMGQGLTVTDAEGRFEYVNPAYARLFGYSPADLIGKRPGDVTLPEDHAILAQAGAQRQRGETTTYETRLVRADGSGVHVLITGVPRRREDQIVGAIAVITDLTERKQAEEALRQSNRELEARNEELDAFAHTVAHDLKNPVSLMITSAELLMDEQSGASDQERVQCASTIHHAGHKMNNIIQELLLLSQLRKADVEKQPLDMASIVEEARQRLAQMSTDYQAEITMPSASIWPAALGYGPWVEEVWVNYLSNAIKYGAAGGAPPRVELGAELEPNNVARFWVRDHGPGIPPEAQAHLFTLFTRLDQVRAKGHGLGLSIVRRIVEKLGGQVGVESRVGQGSTFFFTLPTAG